MGMGNAMIDNPLTSLLVSTLGKETAKVLISKSYFPVKANLNLYTGEEIEDIFFRSFIKLAMCNWIIDLINRPTWCSIGRTTLSHRWQCVTSMRI
jgi:hypothetical protein